MVTRKEKLGKSLTGILSKATIGRGTLDNDVAGVSILESDISSVIDFDVNVRECVCKEEWR